MNSSTQLRCDRLKYDSANISEIVGKYVYNDHLSGGSLTIMPDSSFIEEHWNDLLEIIKYQGKCYVIKDTLKFAPNVYILNDKKRSMSDTLAKIFQTYRKRHYILLRRVSHRIYLIQPYQLIDFCEAVIEEKNKSDFYSVELKQ